MRLVGCPSTGPVWRASSLSPPLTMALPLHRQGSNRFPTRGIPRPPALKGPGTPLPTATVVHLLARRATAASLSSLHGDKIHGEGVGEGGYGRGFDNQWRCLTTASLSGVRFTCPASLSLSLSQDACPTSVESRLTTFSMVTSADIILCAWDPSANWDVLVVDRVALLPLCSRLRRLFSLTFLRFS